MLTEDEVREQIVIEQTKADAIAEQLEAAIAKARATGEYADDIWFAKAKHAKRTIGRNIGRLQMELGKLTRERRRKATEEGHSVNRIFRFKVKEHISEELYKYLLDESIRAAAEQ